jgi:hypothetical protein
VELRLPTLSCQPSSSPGCESGRLMYDSMHRSGWDSSFRKFEVRNLHAKNKELVIS